MEENFYIHKERVKLRMEYIPIFFGVLIALAIFLNIISKMNEHNNSYRKTKLSKNSEKKRIKYKTKLRKRICPLCGSELAQHESLYAEIYEGKERPVVLIHGCKYCYIPSGKKTNFDVSKLDKYKKGV